MSILKNEKWIKFENIFKRNFSIVILTLLFKLYQFVSEKKIKTTWLFYETWLVEECEFMIFQR